MVMMVMMRMIPIVVVPTPVIAVPIVGAIPVVVVVVPRAIVEAVVIARIEIVVIVIGTVRIEPPIPSVADIDVGVATAVAGVIIVVVIHGGAGTCAETLDACCKVSVVVGLGSSVNHAIGVGHGFSGLIDGIDIGFEVLAVRIVGLIVVSRTAADAGRNGAVVRLSLVVRRIIGVIVGHLLVGGAAGDDQGGHQDWNYSKCFHFIVLLLLIFSIFAVAINKGKQYKNYTNMAKELTTRAENYSQWYNDLVVKADLAEQSAVRGCMVIKPYGYAIWEFMHDALDKMFKDTGHVNAYFPLFIPKSFFSREADHVEGFAKECAVVTHHRLMNDPNGNGVVVDPSAKLEEELIVRPTSETIIWDTYRNWVKSYRDLPILCNQWANVVRWEMRTRLFLRTAEFLWQEGHTAHATMEEAEIEAKKMLGVYTEFAEKYLAIPVYQGVKSANERFAGALNTYCIEAMMQDGKALQAGTSHFLGQNFAKAFDVKFLNKENKLEYVWATSWGVSTRLMGALIMSHSDDDGLVLPPKIAPIQVVIVPIYKNDEEKALTFARCEEMKQQLIAAGLRVKFDDRDTQKPGFKFHEWELKGVPVRLVVGPRDVKEGTVELARRDTMTKESASYDGIVNTVLGLMDEIQQNLFQKALKYRNDNTYDVNTWDEFKAQIEKGGFVHAFWDGTTETELKIKEETKATLRFIPLDVKEEEGVDVYSGKPAKMRVYFAKAY